MRVLIACEESQEVCKAFRALGHEAYSCDIEPCSGGHPEWHLQCDALEMLKLKWNLIIAHPPCTYLTNAGATRLRVNGEIVPERYEKAMEAKEFFLKFLNADCPRVAVENPVPSKIQDFRLTPRLSNHICSGSLGLKEHAFGLKAFRALWQRTL